MGWLALPGDPAPVTSNVLDRAFADAGADAAAALDAMRLEEGVPGATAAVAVDGALVWTGAAGWSDLHSMTPITADAMMRIGSTSKAMTATVLARLHDRGVLSMSDAVADHVEAPLNPKWGPLQLRQLMSHTAGLPGYEENTDWLGAIDTIRMRGSYRSVADGLRLVDGSRLLFEPGSDFHYSSFDVNIAGMTAAEAAGVSFPELLRLEIREPLDLGSPRPGDYGPAPADEVPYFETRQRGMGQARSWPDHDVSQRWPGGGLLARSRDLVLVASAWMDPEFIAPETRDLFWTPMRLTDGDVNEQNYALGWRVDWTSSRFGDEREPVRIVHHGGVGKGAMSWLAHYPDLGIAVAVNINTRTAEFGDFARVEPEILVAFAEAAGRVPPMAEPVAP